MISILKILLVLWTSLLVVKAALHKHSVHPLFLGSHNIYLWRVSHHVKLKFIAVSNLILSARTNRNSRLKRIMPAIVPSIYKVVILEN